MFEVSLLCSTCRKNAKNFVSSTKTTCIKLADSIFTSVCTPHLPHIHLQQVSTLTNEGGRLRRHPPISQIKDYEIIPDPVWKALALWYAGGPALPRNVSCHNVEYLMPDIFLPENLQ